jgi:Malectin domain
MSLTKSLIAGLIASLALTQQALALPQINVGGGAYDTFDADEGFTGGTPFVYPSTTKIIGAPDPNVYRSERYGAAFSYALPVGNGTYQVRLSFSENYFNASNQRRFNVTAEGISILNNFDIFAAAGGKNKLIVKALSVTVTDGVLNLVFTGNVDNAKVDAIEIAGTPVTFVKVAGDLQTFSLGSQCVSSVTKTPLSVKVVDGAGVPVSGVNVTFSIQGTTLTFPGISDQFGVATADITFPSTYNGGIYPAPYTVQVNQNQFNPTVPPVTFTGTIQR